MFTKNSFVSLLLALLASSNPYMVQVLLNSGNVKSFFAIALIPLLMIKVFSWKSRGDVAEAVLISVAMLLFHAMAIFVIVPLVLVRFLIALLNKENLLQSVSALFLYSFSCIFLKYIMNNILRDTLKARTDIKFSILFGSRAKGGVHESSDWDVALFFNDNSDAWENMGKKEEIRQQIAKALKIEDQMIDLVDLYQSGLGISATVIDEGVVLSDQDSLELAYYYQGVWAKLEDYYWNIEHAA